MAPQPRKRPDPQSFWADFRRGFVQGFTVSLQYGVPALLGFALGSRMTKGGPIVSGR